jgi:hypothetical protein
MQKRNQYDKMIDFIPASWANALKLECNKLIAKGAFLFNGILFSVVLFLKKKRLD